MTESSGEASQDDLVVVGGGLAGYIAALTAARQDGSASVRLLCLSGDRFRTQSGLIDVLGYLPGSDEPVPEPLSAIEQLPAHHWYATLGPGRVEEALAVFDDTTGERYAGAHTEQNALFPTAVGTLKPASRYPGSTAAGLASTGQPMRLVGFDRLPDLDAELAADRLDERVPYDVTDSSITTAVPVDSVPAAPAFARSLESGEEMYRDSLAEALRSVLDIEPRIGVPAVLGEQKAGAIRTELEATLGVGLFEIPLGAPSIPGRRLESRLDAALEEVGVSIERNVSLAGAETAEGQIEAIRTGTESYHGSAFVLATGGLQAGGLVSSRTGVTEPLLDCPVQAPSSRQDWTAREFLGDHDAVRVGIETDDQLRPAGGSGPVYSNLYAAGQILETTNVIAEQSADGVAILTGYEAGQRAIEQR